MNSHQKDISPENSVTTGAARPNNMLGMQAIARFQVGDRVTATCGSMQGRIGRLTRFLRGKRNGKVGPLPSDPRALASGLGNG